MSDFAEILAKIDMGAYLDREGIEYKETYGSSGEQFNIRTCPFCGGDKHKVFMNAESGLGNCFHGDCDKKFNKYSFIQAHTGLMGRGLVDHIKLVAAEFGWRPPRKKSEPVKLSSADLVIPPSISLPYNGKNLAYLDNRNITADIAKYFHLRFCLKGWFKYQFDGKDAYMNFDNRVIIPVFDVNGNIVSFQGRDITGKADKKYLFPPGFAVTGSHIYNAHNLTDEDTLVVGEGVFDVMAIKIALDKDAHCRNVLPVGTFGKHLSINQLDVMAHLVVTKGVKNVVMMWDAEVQAIDDAIEAGTMIKSLGCKVSISMLPFGKDPNEVSIDEVRKAFWSATPLTNANATMLRLKIREMSKR